LNSIRTALHFTLMIALVLSCSLSAWDEPTLMTFEPACIQGDDSECVPERIFHTLAFHGPMVSVESVNFFSGTSVRRIDAVLQGLFPPSLSSELRL